MRVSTVYLRELYVRYHLTCRDISKKVSSLPGHDPISPQGVWARLSRAGVRAKDGEWVKRVCKTCLKEFEVPRSALKYRAADYHSPTCAGIARSKYVKDNVLDRAIVQQHFRLAVENIIHHKDDNPKNNDRCNLLVFKNQEDYTKFLKGQDILPIWDGGGTKYENCE